ncbi:MAG: hypothetical protein HZA50_06665 [Planctomycetes bacterium]|nr:hypothetical protein [Planctomycetota bacterium]
MPVLLLMAVLSVLPAGQGSGSPPADNPAATASATSPVVSQEEIKKLIAQLGDNRVKVHEAAAVKLIEIGEPAMAALRDAIANKETDPQTVRRAREIHKPRRVISGSFYADSPEIGNQHHGNVGASGCLVVRSLDRWDAIQKHFAASSSDGEVNLDNVSFDPSKMDFQKDMIVGVFACKAPTKNGISAQKLVVKDGKGELEFLMTFSSKMYRTYGWQFTFAVVPASLAELKVSVWTCPVLDAESDEEVDPASAKKEWTVNVGPDSGDVVGGLTGIITVKDRKIKAGQDIRAEFTLKMTDKTLANGRFLMNSSYFILEGKYSFEVVGPDGKTQKLEPKKPADQEKPAKPIEITPEKPYIIPVKLQADLKLDTSKPGKYVIRAVFEETSGWLQKNPHTVFIWGGNIATNSITVEVE